MHSNAAAAQAAPTEAAGDVPAAVAVQTPPEPFAEVRVRITHNAVVFTAILGMGGQHVEIRRWNRYRGHGKGWLAERGGDFVNAQDRISLELAEYVDRLDFPYAVANMLPGKRSAADCAAAAEAAKAVANG